ncbi:MAG: HNH endonuclease [Candidatus Binatia bacterium]
MPRLSAIRDPHLDYEGKNWAMDEDRASYIQARIANCDHMQLLDLRRPGFLCENCFGASVDGIFVDYRPPDICSATWKTDFAREFDEDLLADLRRSRKASPAYALECGQCLRLLRPWSGESIYVQTRELAEQLNSSDEVYAIKPSSKVKKRILQLYGRACFGCGRRDVSLHIDHIQPRSRGGNAAFRNLQPLCNECGRRKGNQVPAEVVMFLPLP